MQYSHQAACFARGNLHQSRIVTMFTRSAYALVAAITVLLLGGCASSMPDTSRLQRFTEVIRGYDSTLTKTEKEAAISDLQNEKERQQGQVQQTAGAPKTN